MPTVVYCRSERPAFAWQPRSPMMQGRSGGSLRMVGRMVVEAAACTGALLAQWAAKQLPPPFQTPSADNRPKVIAQPDGAAVKVRAGFTAEVAADGFDTPRFMLLGPSNEILM